MRFPTGWKLRSTTMVKIYQQRYERGKVMEKLKVIGDCEERKTGTKVTFLPDDTIFETTSYDFDVLKQRFREMAFLTKGLRIVLKDERKSQKKEYSTMKAVSKNLLPI